MKRRLLACGAAALITPSVLALGTAITIDLLDPSETSGTIPANLRIVDVFVDIAPPLNWWTAAGVRLVATNGAMIAYHDGDANIPGVQPGLFNPGLADRFLTSLSAPRGRNANGRFTNANAAAAGGYNPPSPLPTTSPTELNVAYFRPNKPDPAPPVHEFGYIARLSVDISSVPGAPPTNELWGVGLTAPAGATIVLQSEPPPPPATQSPGTAFVTFQNPVIRGLNWQLWFVPEPNSILLLTAGVFLLIFQCRIERSTT